MKKCSLRVCILRKAKSPVLSLPRGVVKIKSPPMRPSSNKTSLASGKQRVAPKTRKRAPKSKDFIGAGFCPSLPTSPSKSMRLGMKKSFLPDVSSDSLLSLPPSDAEEDKAQESLPSLLSSDSEDNEVREQELKRRRCVEKLKSRPPTVSLPKAAAKLKSPLQAGSRQAKTNFFDHLSLESPSPPSSPKLRPRRTKK